MLEFYRDAGGFVNENRKRNLFRFGLVLVIIFNIIIILIITIIIIILSLVIS